MFYLTKHSTHWTLFTPRAPETKKERNVLFNNALNTSERDIAPW